MKLLKRILLGLLFVTLLFAAILVGSVLIDALAGGSRVAELTNTVISTDTGRSLSAYVARPPGEGPFPTVIMLHEFWGLKPEIIGKADALAAEGYVVVAPDMYRGQTTGLLPRAIYLALTILRPRCWETWTRYSAGCSSSRK